MAPRFPPSSYHSLVIPSNLLHHDRRRCLHHSCCRLCLWTIAALLVTLLLAAISISILYSHFHPRIPTFSLDGINLTRFTHHNNYFDVAAPIVLYISNNNAAVWLVYAESQILVYPSGKLALVLAEATVPEFLQEPMNSTVIKVTATAARRYVAKDKATELDRLFKVGALLMDFEWQVTVDLVLGWWHSGKVPVKVHCYKIEVMKVEGDKPNCGADLFGCATSTFYFTAKAYFGCKPRDTIEMKS